MTKKTLKIEIEIVSINLKKAGVGQPKYYNNVYVHVVLTNLSSIFSYLVTH